MCLAQHGDDEDERGEPVLLAGVRQVLRLMLYKNTVQYPIRQAEESLGLDAGWRGRQLHQQQL